MHEKKIAGIADKIAASNKDVRLVLIAGPSSSGKTTFAQRLSIQMVVNGLRPVPVSMDDYFKDRHDTPRKPDGTFDLKVLTPLIWSFLMTTCAAFWQGSALKCLSIIPQRHEGIPRA